MTAVARTLDRDRIRAGTLWEPKDLARRHEWEDGASLSTEAGHFAVADGASEAFDAREWALALTTAHRQSPPEQNATSQEWSKWFSARAAEFDARNSPANLDADEDAWLYSGHGARAPYATFLGVRLVWLTSGQLVYQAHAVGDACLFHVRGHQLVSSWPLRDIAEFGTHPALVCGSPSGPAVREQDILTASQELFRGDVLLLGSDAISKWMIQFRASRRTWRFVKSIQRHGFQEFVTGSRQRGQLDPDDVTLTRIRIGLPAAR